MREAAQTEKASAWIPSAFALVTRSSFWLLCVDIYPALVAASLPWSTSAVSILIVVWFFVLSPTIEPRSFLLSIRRAACWLPFAFFALAVVGMLWADGSWLVKVQGLSPVAKLLVLPFLFYHFGRSTRAHWVLISFLGSCTLLLAYSWVIYFAPAWRFTIAHGFNTTGVPVRNVIDQNQEFALCFFICASLALMALRRYHVVVAAAFGVLSAAFISNIIFVALARTSIAYIVPLAAIFVVWHFQNRIRLFLFMGLPIVMTIAWYGSANLRERVQHISVEYMEYRESNRPTSTGQRLEYWRVSIRAIAEAPLFGHGTGATKQLFDREAEGKSGAWADSIRNPHNQTLSVAVQWGILGCIILYAMWYFHLMLFREASLAGWVGFIVVCQNFFSSLLNSHLFDFHEGWMYVLGVGVAGGICQSACGLRRRLNAES
jgi:O-antigen ligase